MRFKQVAERPKTYVLIFETGDDLPAGLQQFAVEQKMAGSSFKAIGALSSVKLGWFNWETKKYETSVHLEEQVELLSIIGDIALKGDQPVVHAHVVVGKRDGTAHGGHLQAATVRPTCEVVLTENPSHLHKLVDKESGVALIRL
jgi:predicted DNA-binding protein with PD1-like motif